MKVLLLLTAVLTVAYGSNAPPLATECIRPGSLSGQSLLSSLLQVAGYSDICVAAALDYCSSLQDDDHFTSFMKEARVILQQVSMMVNNSEFRPRHCKDLLDSGDSGSGPRVVYPYPGQPHHRVTVFCDHTVDGGGWTVFQRRNADVFRQDFYRTWIEYQLGFGDIEGEFWIGLDHLHQLTSTTLQQMRVDLDDNEGGHRWATYGFFYVGPPDSKYRLKIGRYSGDAGDAMAKHNGAQFSTPDAEHDYLSSNNVAVSYRGAWWYNNGHHSNLNGYKYVGQHSTFADGINWNQWRGFYYSMKRASMMIRPAF